MLDRYSKIRLFLFALVIITAVQSAFALPVAQIFNGHSISGKATSYPLIIGMLPDDESQICSGIFVSQTRVLTAQHCVTSADVPRKRIPLYVFQGKKFVRVKAVIKSKEDDLAILVLKPVKTARPMPIILSKYPSAGKIVTVYGYGLDERQQSAVDYSLTNDEIDPALLDASLKEANVRVEYLEKSDVEGTPGVSTYMIVSNFGDGKPCAGDSGGPATISYKTGRVVVGVLSWGEVSDTGPLCEAEGLSGYVSFSTERVAKFLRSNIPDGLFR